MKTNETNNGLPGAQHSEVTNALRQRLALDKLKLIELDETIRKTKNALHKAQNEIEAMKKSGGQL